MIRDISETFKPCRRRFLGNAARAIAAARLGMIGALNVSFNKINDGEAIADKQDIVTLLGKVKQINAGVLNIGYAEEGPADGPSVILLHGWPYDIHSFA